MYSVYILSLSNGQQYVGFSEDIKQRLIDHQEGKCDTTAKYRPVRLVWCCHFHDKKKALSFEKYLKSGSGAEFRRRHF
jgi:predicted GIY-YIG superfamily endonuclease